MRVRALQTLARSLALSGCSVAPKPVSLDERSALAQTDREGMFAGVPPLTGALSLEEAIALKKIDLGQKLLAIAQMDAVLGLDLLKVERADLRVRPKSAIISEAEIEAALAARKEARASKDFAASDAIRDDLIAKGVEVMDGDPLGWDWKIEV